MPYGGTSGITYYNQTGTYTKIGDVCHFYISMHINSPGSSSGTCLIGGLPFSIRATSYGMFIPLGARGNVNSGGEPVSFYTGDASLRKAPWNGNGNGSVTNPGGIETGAEINISGHYYV